MPAADSLLTWLATATVRGSILITVVLLLQVVLRNWMPARWRLAMWLPAMVVLAVPLLPESKWGLHGEVIEKVAGSAWCCPSGDPACVSGSGISLGTLGAGQAQAGWKIIVGCWLLGTMWFLGVVWWSHRRSMRKLRETSVSASDELMQRLAEITSAIGLRRIPAVLVCAELSGPAVTGLWRPILLLPARFPGELNEEESRLVLQHELLHIRRLDLWTNGLLCLIQAVHWFNPVAWFAVSRIRFDCEQACDEEVLTRNGAESRTPYGHALIKIACGLPASDPNLAVLHMARSAAGLRTRIEAITSRRPQNPVWAILWVSLIAGVTVAGATRSPYGIPAGISFFGGRPSAAVQRAQHLVLPQVEIRDATVRDAVTALEQLSRTADSQGEGLRVWLTPEAESGTKELRVSIFLSQASAWQALETLAQQARISVDANGEVICLKRTSTSGLLPTGTEP